jgi:hypothetical protein
MRQGSFGIIHPYERNGEKKLKIGHQLDNQIHENVGVIWASNLLIF